MTSSLIKAVIIDLDGTLADTAPDFHAAINALRAELNLSALNQTTVTSFVGRGSEHLVRSALTHDASPEFVAQHFNSALTRYFEIYRPLNGVHAALYPNVVAGLQAMQNAGLRLAVVTNKPHDFAVELLKKLKLFSYFEAVLGGDSLPQKKPHPAPMLKIAEIFDLSVTKIVAIGDSVNDMQAARAAGCAALAVPYGYHHNQDLIAAGANGIVSDLLEAAHLLQHPPYHVA